MKIQTGVELVEQVREFKCLGSLKSEDGCREKEIRSRIVIADVHGQEKLFTGKLNLELKKRITKCMHGLECGTVCCGDMDADSSKLEAFEMWICRMGKQLG